MTSLAKTIQSLKYIFLNNIDTASPEGRSLNRYRQAARTSFAAIITRALSIISNFILIPITLNYLGEEKFGLWMTLTSLIFFMTFADLGLGVGLQNALARCYGNNDTNTPKYYISSGLCVIILLFIIFICIAVFLLPALPIQTLIKTKDATATNQILPTAQAMFIAFSFGLPASVLRRIFDAHQKGYWGYILYGVGIVLGLGGALLCIYYKRSLPSLAFTYIWPSFFIPLIGSLALFWKHSWLRPSIKSIRIRFVKEIFGTGLTAMGAQVATLLLVSGLPFIIANRVGASEVVPFSLTQKLLGVMTMLLTMGISPLWPAYSEAAAKGDWLWVNKTFFRTVKIAFILTVPLFFLVALCGRWLISIWTGNPDSTPTWSVLMAWNIWTLLHSWNLVCRIMLSGLNHMLGQATYGIIFGAIGLTITYFMAPSSSLSIIVWTAVILGEGLFALGFSIEVYLQIKANKIPSHN